MIAPLSHDPLWPRAGGWPPGRDGEQVDLALIGIPTWRTSLSATGAAATPSAVRAALRFYSEWAAGVTRWPRIVDWGDIPEPDGVGDDATATGARAAAIAAVARAARHASLIVALGGDNAATVPAALGTWGDRIGSAGLVTLDAHHDLRDGDSNGSPVRRLIEAGLPGHRIAQLGIADFANSPAYAARAAAHGITVVPRSEVDRRPIGDLVTEAIDLAGAAGGPVHVDLDVDVCDRSVAPGCPASAPGGIAAAQLRVAARAAGRHPLVESIDLTEVDATADARDGRTVRLVALCVLEIAAGWAER